MSFKDLHAAFEKKEKKKKKDTLYQTDTHASTNPRIHTKTHKYVL